MAKETSKKTTNDVKKDVEIKAKNVKKETKKTREVKSKVTEKKTKANSTVKKVPAAKSASKKTSTTAKTKKATPTNAKTGKRSTTSKSKTKPMLTEYYDLPYSYNQTVVKVLAQTPTTLFVYWDISKEDRESLEALHGKDFFNTTIPILIVHNVTKNYSFEIEINDFANSWYIRTQEPDCDYIIELGRKFIETSNNQNNQYVHISSSNDIISPNDHILFEKANLGNVLFKNAKTNVVSSKDFGTLAAINNIDKLYGNVYDVYSQLYDEQTLEEVSMPTSAEFIRK